MYLLAVMLPFISFCLGGGFGRFLGLRGASLVASLCVGFSCLLSCLLFYEVALCGSPCYIRGISWIDSGMFDASWGFLFDSLTVVMFVVVTFVSTLVHLYSMAYMGQDPHLPRFMSYLSLFTFFMLMLVSADNFIMMFFGWEGVGLASYLLINFWFTRLQANKSAIKAFLVNRVGDFGFALGIMGIFSFFQSVNFTTIFSSVHCFVDAKFIFCTYEVNALNTLCLLLFIGAIGKSAQLGLHTWLPDAMEGPTPVSALIHAATMVTAGVFLLARCSPLFEFAPFALICITFLGAMTSFFAATTGIVQNDLKRVIAYSTCSQLGYMIFACGISHYSLGVFHLMNHAFFKALLFLSAGSVIHALSDEQDMRKMGGSLRSLPFTYAMMLIGSLALIGFPFLTGFYSKDVILEVAYAKYTLSGNFAYWLGTASALLTSYYSFRLLILTFLSPTSSIPSLDLQSTNTFKTSISSAHEAPFLMALPLFLLGLGSIFVGYLGKDMMIGQGTDFWGNALFTLPQNTLFVESEYIPQFIKSMPLFLCGIGAFIAFQINASFDGKFPSNKEAYGFILSPFAKSIYTFLNKRWFFDKVYNDLFVHKALSFGYKISFQSIDKGMIEVFGPYGIQESLREFSHSISKLQSGMIYHYAFLMLLGLSLFVGIIGCWDFISYWVDNRLYFIHFISFCILSIRREETARLL